MINNNIYIIIKYIIILNPFIQYIKIPNTQKPKIPRSQLRMTKRGIPGVSRVGVITTTKYYLILLSNSEADVSCILI